MASVVCGSSTTLYSWAAGRLTNVSWQAGSDLRAVRYAYKENSDLLAGCAISGGGSQSLATVSRAYDVLNRLTNISSSVLSVPSVVNSFSYTLDSVGRRTTRQDVDGSSLAWKYDSYDQLTNAARSGSANGAADAAYNYGYQYDEIGNRLHEDRGQLDLDGGFNNLNQLTALKFGGKLDIVGTATTTNPPLTVKVDGATATLFQGTNYWGGGRVKTGSNTISIVACDASSNRTETLRRGAAGSGLY